MEQLVEPLDRRQSHTVRIHGGDVLVVFTDAERGVEILGHWTNVADRIRLGPIAPSRDRHLGEPGEHLRAVDSGDSLLRIPIAEGGPGATPGCERDARRRSSAAVDRAHEARAAD